MPHRVDKALLETLTAHLANSPLSVIGWDRNFRVAFWSGQAENVFGWREEELIGKHPADWPFMHEDDVAEVSAVMDDLAQQRVVRNISRNRNYTRDGSVLHCEWYNSVLTGDDGELLSILSLVQDVTERTSMEAQFRQLQKMQAIGQLTGGIAHDFNNLITVILGNSELLVDSLANQPELAQLATMVISAAERGAGLTQQLLAFARQQPLDPRPVDVNALLRDAYSMFARTLGEQVELELDLAENLPRAQVDPGQLESALLNLCLNARDAMPGGGYLTLETSITTLDGDYARENSEVIPGDYVLLAVSDTGSGIDAELLDKVFEPFFTTKGPGAGSGLGLSMVFGFIKQSRGHIKVYSESGEGTTVRIYLPLAEAGEADNPRTLVAADGVSATGSENILLVEDDELVRQYAATQLAMLGYRVLRAANGVEALEILGSDAPIDLLFTDVVMPGGVDGPELARRAQALRPALRVLYTSGYTQNAIVHHGRLDPGVRLLSKPYQRSALARCVREALDDG
jgi:PAS domain S-box-containing protein